MKNKQLENRPDSSLDQLVKTRVFGVDISNEKEDEILEFLLEKLEEKKEKFFIVTPNPEMIVYAAHHPEFKKILNSAKIALCDGMQLFRASRFIGKPIQERITGVEFMETICKYISKKPITVGFLGGRSGVAKEAADRLSEKYPGLKVVFVGEEAEEIFNFQFLIFNKKYKKTSKNINKKMKLDEKTQKHIDILFVAFGFPKQEEFMFTNISKLDVSVMMGVGGAFDYISGRVPRAPQLVRNLGFEWLYRLIRQPWRWRRQLALIEFMGMVIKERLRLSH